MERNVRLAKHNFFIPVPPSVKVKHSNKKSCKVSNYFPKILKNSEYIHVLEKWNDPRFQMAKIDFLKSNDEEKYDVIYDMIKSYAFMFYNLDKYISERKWEKLCIVYKLYFEKLKIIADYFIKSPLYFTKPVNSNIWFFNFKPLQCNHFDNFKSTQKLYMFQLKRSKLSYSPRTFLCSCGENVSIEDDMMHRKNGCKWIKLNENYTCGCGSIISLNYINNHLRTKKHHAFLEEKRKHLYIIPRRKVCCDN